MKRNFEEYSTKELGIYVIKKLHEMGYTEKQIKMILNHFLDISIKEKLEEMNKRH